MNDDMERGTAHHTNAKQARDIATVRTDNAVTMQWNSPQALRECSQEQELGDQCFQAMMVHGAVVNRANWSAYRHTCWVKARAVVVRVPVLIAQSLREVFAQLIALGSHAPPGLITAPNVLATCHASNAPGLFPIAMNYWQVPRA